MKRTFTFFIAAGMFFLTGCSSEEVAGSDTNELNAATTTIQAGDYTMTDLVGLWTMYSMSSLETTVDFDQDGIRTNDLLEETDCFDFMYFHFKETGAVDTRQSRLYFSSTTGKFSCQTTGDYSAIYSVNADQLTVTFTVNGEQYTETKTIALFTEGGSEYLKVTLTKEETNSAVYVADDPGNTVASEIQKIEMVYIKTQ